MFTTWPEHDIFVARQPIFDHNQKLFAYELLYRNSLNNVFTGVNATSATIDVIRNTFLILGTQLTGAKKVFINFTRALLQNRSALTLHPHSTVIEILEDVKADEETIMLGKELKESGYSLAIDDFDLVNTSTDGFIPIADIIKVDCRSTTPEERRKIIWLYRRSDVQFLAEKVESIEEFEEAKRDGFDFFQGYFFGKPVIVSAKDIPGYKLNYVRLLEEVNRRDLDFSDLTKLIMSDTYLSYTLLNYMNSAYFGLHEAVHSIGHALMLMGEREVRKWASLIALTFIGEDKPSEVIVSSLVRAKFCESMALTTGLRQQSSELFMLGMFSMLDVLIGRPIEELLEKMHLSGKVKDALSGRPSPYENIFKLIVHYERADWQGLDTIAKELKIDVSIIPALYLQSVEWADRVYSHETGSGVNRP